MNTILNLACELKDKKQEQQFQDQIWPFYSRTTVPITLFMIISAIALNIENMLLFKITDSLKIFILIDSIIFISGFIIIISSLINRIIKAVPYTAIILFLAVGLHNTAEIVLSKSSIEGYYFIGLIGTILIFFIFFRHKFIITLTTSIFLSIFHIYLVYAYLNPGINELVKQIIVLSLTNLVGSYAFLRINAGERKKFLYKTISEETISELNQDIKKLRSETKAKKTKIEELETQLKKEINKGCEQSFEDVLRVEFDRSRRYNQDLAIVMLNIRNLNSIAKAHGKKAALLIINKVHEICKDAIRPGDSVFKSEGKKFEFILPSTDEYGAVSLAERVKDSIQKYRYIIEGKRISVELSTGIACFEDEENYMELIKNSEVALKKALKRSGNESVFI